MPTTIPPRTEDVISGGGSFSACLERAIRRPSTDNNNKNTTTTATTSFNSNAINNNKNSLPHIQEAEPQESQQLIDEVVEEEEEDWSSHHVSYHLLQECLAFFSRRRAAARSLLRENNANNNTNRGGGGSITEAQLNQLIRTHTTLAPDLNNAHVMQYAQQRSLGKTPPRGYTTTLHHHQRDKTYWMKRSNIFTRSLRCGQCLTEEEFVRDEENSFAASGGGSVGGIGGTTSEVRYFDMMGNEGGSNEQQYYHHPEEDDVENNNHHEIALTCEELALSQGIRLSEADVIKQLSFIERVELSAVLDSEVERAAMFYRHRLAELAPPREDGEVLPKKFTDSGGGEEGEGGGLDGDYHNNNDTRGSIGGIGGANNSTTTNTNPEFNDLLPYKQQRNPNDQDILDIIDESPTSLIDTLSFTTLGSEILELHAFITINIIVVRQILIRYDAFVRSLGGSPMSSWYQKSRRVRKNGRSSDFRDLMFHSKLRRLTLAYIGEYKLNLADYNTNTASGGGEEEGGRRRRRRLRLQGFANQFHKLVDAAEEIKRRQRAKWRQPAMSASAMDFGEGFESMQEKEEEGMGIETVVRPTPVVAMEEERRNQTPPAIQPAVSTDSFLETPLSERTGDEATVPSPPLQPPDYASLLSNPDIGEDIEYQVYIFKCVQSKTQRSIEKTYTGRASGVRDNFITTLREYFLLGSTLNNLSLMPEYLIMRGKSLKSSLLVVAQWRDARKANLYGIKSDPEEVGCDSWFGGFRREPQPVPSSSSSSSTNTSFCLVLNILSCFLYMMNYYIVGPSSVQYANALGAKDAMSGLIIGAMPWAALVSAVIFSMWSNRSYRAPLLASSVLLISGNVLYSSAYRQGSLIMALCGRFLTGLGGPRSMNRRYIADTTPLVHRTAANAAFGTATALGAAVGPAMAVALDNFDFELELPLYGTFYFNAMTGPGYLMSVLWTIYLLLAFCMFREPVRSGLIEQVERERQIEATNSSIQAIPTIQTYPSEYEMSSLEQPGSSLARYHERGDSTVTNYERGESAFSRFEQDDSIRTNYEQDDSVHTNEVNDCAACPVENRVGFGSNNEQSTPKDGRGGSFWSQVGFVFRHMTPAVHLCMFLIFSKQFTVENLISGASMVTKNRYGWDLKQVGKLATMVGCLTIPISIFVGWVSQYREDVVLMFWLITCATIGMALLVDPTDFISAETDTFNEGDFLAVGPHRYYVGYLLVFCSIQAFDGVVGSVLSKVIPTALAAGTLNSGLLATIVGTLGRALGDAFITAVGYINLRQVQNLLFVPSLVILVADLLIVFTKRETLTA